MKKFILSLLVIGITSLAYSQITTIASDKGLVLPKLKQAVKEVDPFQIAILDQPRHTSDGIVLGQAIRKLSEFDGLRLIALTGLGHRGDAAAFKKAGFSAYLNKPVLDSTLVMTMRSVLNNRDPGGEIVTRHLMEDEHESRLAANSFNGRVLLVDDVRANQKVAESMLIKLGVEVDLAENGLHAILQWKKGDYDLIYMDCRMPEMDGYEATRTPTICRPDIQ